MGPGSVQTTAFEVPEGVTPPKEKPAMTEPSPETERAVENASPPSVPSGSKVSAPAGAGAPSSAAQARVNRCFFTARSFSAYTVPSATRSR